MVTHETRHHGFGDTTTLHSRADRVSDELGTPIAVELTRKVTCDIQTCTAAEGSNAGLRTAGVILAKLPGGRTALSFSSK